MKIVLSSLSSFSNYFVLLLKLALKASSLSRTESTTVSSMCLFRAM